MWMRGFRGWLVLGVVVAAVWLVFVTLAANASTPADLRQMAGDLFGVPSTDIEVGSSTGKPAAREVRRNGRIIGYLASTAEVAHSVGYSGKPIDILVAIDLKATIVGARLIAQSEPILTLGILPSDIAAYVSGFSRYDLAKAASAQGGDGLPDAISGATISSGVIRDGIVRTGRAVALSRGLIAGPGGRHLDMASFSPRSWSELADAGAITERHIELGEARATLSRELYRVAGTPDSATFIDLYLAVLNPPGIGQNLLGRRDYEKLMAELSAGDTALFIAASGLYSFKGTAWRKTGRFERIEIIQGNHTITLDATGHGNVEQVAVADAHDLREAGRFIVPAASGFDATRPFRLSLIASHDIDSAALSTSFFLDYALPEAFLTGPVIDAGAPKQAPALWEENWRHRVPAIVFTSLLLSVLTVILVFQDWLVQHYRLYRWTRMGFLAVTLVGLGWGLGAQLSVVHVLAFTQALRTGFQWENFLLDPVVFILWSFVAIALLFWGRGVFCGWLCPFGALQELVNEAARALHIRQIPVPFALHERLWPIKYVIFLGLFALSLKSITQAFEVAEVEPFKTAITLHFWRAWPFVAYAGGLLVAGLFVERFFCRYLCPLGAALAIPARLSMFQWLKRRPQCGTECRICATRCTVEAIHPDGHINPNECIHCLNCQTLYYDPTTCPPLKARVQRRAAHQAAVARSGQERQKP